MHNLPHTILKDAIDFSLTNPTVKNWIGSRDRDPNLTIKEIKTRIIGITNDIVSIQIGIDYTGSTNPNIKNEDILIDLVWRHTAGFQIVKIFPSNL